MLKFDLIHSENIFIIIIKRIDWHPNRNNYLQYNFLATTKFEKSPQAIRMLHLNPKHVVVW